MNGLGNIIKEKFGPEIPPHQKTLIRGSALYLNWLAKAMEEFRVEEVYFVAAHVVSRGLKPHVLFLHLKTKAFLGEKPIPGVVFLRGSAVGVIVELLCEGERHFLFTKQARLGPGSAKSLEIPAGMLDGASDPKAVALKELKEETGLQFTLEELFPLRERKTGESGVLGSVGVSDEVVFLYGVKRNVSPGELKALQGQIHGCAEEGETIELLTLTHAEAMAQVEDSKSLLALLLLEKNK